MFYDRDILGLWVSGEGMVYRDFNKDTMKINRDDVPDELTFIVVLTGDMNTKVQLLFLVMMTKAILIFLKNILNSIKRLIIG